MVNCGILQTQREGGEAEGNWNGSAGTAPCSKLSRGRAGINPPHPQRVQRAGVDSDWSELYFCHKRIKAHFQRICGHTHSHNGNVHMDCIPSRALVTGNPRSGLLLTNVTQPGSAQGAPLWCLGWVNAASWFHCALLPCHKRQDALSHGAFISLWDKTQPEGNHAI